MKAIILSAGAGRRLGLDGPKSLADVAGRSILHRQVAAFTAAGVDQFVVVVGYQAQAVRAHLAGLPGHFTFVENPDYATTNTIYSLYLARQHLEGGSFYANADVVFDRRLTDRLARSPDPNALAVLVGACAEEEVKVVVRDGRIVEIGKKLEPARCLGEFVGVARFGADMAGAFVESLEEQVVRRQVRTDYFERALDAICHRVTLTSTDVSDLPCREVDFPEDLAQAREQLAPLLVD